MCRDRPQRVNAFESVGHKDIIQLMTAQKSKRVWLPGRTFSDACVLAGISLVISDALGCVQSSWAMELCGIGKQAMLGAEGAEEGQGHKAYGIQRPCLRRQQLL